MGILKLERIIANGKSEIGKQKEGTFQENQDSFYISPNLLAESEADKGKGFFIIADGLKTMGHEASQMAVGITAEGLNKLLAQRISIGDLYKMWDIAEKANKAIREKRKEKPVYEAMGTTLTLALIKDRDLRYVHIGDSRLYVLYSDGVFRQETRDANAVQRDVDNRIITPEEAMADPRSSDLQHYLGKEESLNGCSRNLISLANEGRTVHKILLITDGIYHMVWPKDIERVVKEGDPKDIPDELIRLANNPGEDIIQLYAKILDINDPQEAKRVIGGNDNMTCIAAKLEYK